MSLGNFKNFSFKKNSFLKIAKRQLQSKKKQKKTWAFEAISQKRQKLCAVYADNFVLI